MSYGGVDNGVEGINGGIGPFRDGSSRVTLYIAVVDPDAYLREVEARGGETVMETTEIPGLVTLAQFRDRGGHVGRSRQVVTAERRHRGSDWVPRFTDRLYPDTVEPPRVTDFTEVAST